MLVFFQWRGRAESETQFTEQPIFPLGTKIKFNTHKELP